MAPKKKQEPKHVTAARPVVAEVAEELAPPVAASKDLPWMTAKEFGERTAPCEHAFAHRGNKCTLCGAERSR